MMDNNNNGGEGGDRKDSKTSYTRSISSSSVKQRKPSVKRPDSVARADSAVESRPLTPKTSLTQQQSNKATKKVSIIARRKSSTASEASTTQSEAGTSDAEHTHYRRPSRHQYPAPPPPDITTDPAAGDDHYMANGVSGEAAELGAHKSHGFLKVPSIASLTKHFHLHHGGDSSANLSAQEQARRKYSHRAIRFSTAVPPPADLAGQVRRKQSRMPSAVAPPAAEEIAAIQEQIEKERLPWWRKIMMCCRGHKGAGGAVMKKNEKLQFLKRDLVIDDHELSLEQLREHYQVDFTQGLSPQQAVERLARDGPNILTPPPQTPEWKKFMHEFLGGFAILVWVAAVLSFLAFVIQIIQNPDADKDNMFLGIALVVVNVVSGLLSYYQVSKSEKIMESFKKLMPQKALVLRNGELHEISAAEVCLGDICEVKFGDRIPADLRVIEAHSMKVDNSALTGESEPQSRSPEMTSKNPLETKNLAFFSTNCLEGTGRGVVCGIGDNTVMGRIASLTAGLEAGETSLARELNLVVLILAVMGVSFGITFFIVSGLLGHSWIDSIVYLVGIICGNVPLGMVAAISISLALAAKRMAAKQCLIKNLELVETLGSCSTICSDKTGTLTQNRMTVAHLYYDNKILAADTDETQTQNDDRLKQYAISDTFTDVWRCAVLCNRATFRPGQENVGLMKRECNGDASETALLKFVELVVGNTDKIRAANKKICEVPFNSTNKYQVSIHEQSDRPNYMLVMKGAAERIAQRCTTIMINHEVLPFDAARREMFNNAYLELGGMGERVLGFCHMELPLEQFPRNYPFSADDVNFPVEKLTFLGLMSMIDPPRATVPDAVRRCKAAGIRVVMVTGDHPITATAIARGVGIIGPTSKTVEDLAVERGCAPSDVDPREARACVIHGEMLKDITAIELDTIIMRHPELVFARTSPQQKLLIVEGFQRCGDRVAVTGDGVNDSPALKQANIGIAMGITGSDVSKQAADMILLDDNFASIVTGIEEGRTVYDNLKKNVVYNMTKGFPELIPFLLFIVCNIPLPIGTVTIIFIDMGSDMLPSISFSYEKPESDIMKRKPRRPDERMVTPQVLQRAYMQFGVIEVCAAMFTYFVVYAENGFWPRSLFGIEVEWDNPANNSLEDSYGQQWTYKQRKNLEYTVYTAYFCTVILVQGANLLTCKTRRMSLIEKGLDNPVINFAILLGISFGCFCSYVPFMRAVHMYPIRFVWWLPGLPYVVMILGYNEWRQYCFRYWPGSWLDREMFY